MASSEHGFSVMSYPLTPSDQPIMSTDQDSLSRLSKEQARASSRQFYPSDYAQDSRFQNSPFSHHNSGVPGRYPESSQRTGLQEDRSGNPMPVGGIYCNEAGDVHRQGLIASPSDHMFSTDRNGSRHPSDLYPPSLDNTHPPTSRDVLPSLAERVGKVAFPHIHIPTHPPYQPDSLSYGPSILPLSGPKVPTGISSGLPNLTVFEAQYQGSQHGSELPQMDSDVHITATTTTSPRPRNLVIDNVCGLPPSTLSSIPMSNSPDWSQSQPLVSSNAFDAQPYNPITGASLIGHSSSSSIPESDSAPLVSRNSSGSPFTTYSFLFFILKLLQNIQNKRERRRRNPKCMAVRPVGSIFLGGFH